MDGAKKACWSIESIGELFDSWSVLSAHGTVHGVLSTMPVPRWRAEHVIENHQGAEPG